MTISSTPTLLELQAEFGGTLPVELTDYLRDGGLVPDTGTNSGVPDVVPVSLLDFVGASAANPVTATIGGLGTINDSTSPYDYSRAFTVTPSGGTGSYTYAWSFSSNPGGFNFNGSTTTATATIELSTTSPGPHTATAQCVVTEIGGSGQSDTPTKVVTLETA